MTTSKELRELDVEIEEKLFGRHRVEASYYVWPSTEEVEAIKRVYPKIAAIGYEPARFFTIEAAASMLVLEKCAKHLSPDGGGNSIAIEWLGDIVERWRVQETDVYDGSSAEAETLPLAICLFARNLFEKGKKYQCENCGSTHPRKQDVFCCLWCEKEICESCMAQMATCQSCAAGRTDKELQAKFDASLIFP